MATLTNKRRRELEALRMKMLRGEIRRIARKQGRALSEAEVNKQVANFEAFREKVKQLESGGDYTAKNKSPAGERGKKPTSASGAYQFVKGSVDPAYNRLKRLAGEVPEFRELLKHKDAAKVDPVLQDMMFTADILQKNIQDKTGKKKPGEGDRLLVGVFAGNKEAASNLYVQGHHTDIKSPRIVAYANKGFGVATAPNIATPTQQIPVSEYSPEERQAIANAYKVDPSGNFAENVRQSIDAQKIKTPTAPEGLTSGRLAIQAAIDAQNQEVPTQQAPTSQYSPEEVQAIENTYKIDPSGKFAGNVKKSIDAQNTGIEKGALTERGMEAVADRYKRKVAGPVTQAPRSGDTSTQPIMAGPVTEAPTSEDKSIQGIQQVTPLNTTELETAQQKQVIPEEFSMQSGMQYGGELPLVTSEQIARATEIERRRKEAVARKYRRGLGYASSELTGQRNPFAGGGNPFAGGGMVYDYAGGGKVAARGLASLGRGPDTELVHMSPREVGALDDLARATGLQGLPVNPQTGLPEAGILDSIAPIVIGVTSAALAPATGGGSLLANPFFVGGMSALGAGIASGFDTAQMAKWGLGVGGGAGLYGSLAGAGAATPAGQAAQQTQLAGQQAAEQAALKAAGANPAFASNLGAQGIAAEKARLAALPAGWDPATVGARANVGRVFGADGTGFEGAKQLFGVGAREATLGLPTVSAGIGSIAASEYKDPPKFTPVGLPTTDPTYPKGGYRAPPRKSIDPFRGERTVADSGEALYFDPEPYTAPGYVPNENTTSREGIASTETPTEFRGDVAGVFNEMAQQYEDSEEEKRRRQAQGLFYARAGGIVPYSNGGEVADTGEATYFAPDRATTLPQTAALSSNPDVSRMLHNANLWQNASNQGVHIRDWAHMSPAERGKYGDPYYGSGMERRTPTGIEAMPQGGVDRDIGELAYFNQGGLTQGPGDGMSDDIMLPITGTPDIAAVSPDEFVVPADVVSGLGNGSTSAGARQLYSMMDKVRDARTGKTAQPRSINPARMMPV